MFIAVRMALLAEDVLGKLTEQDLLVTVVGHPCLADCIQGLTRARLANPARFFFERSESTCRTIWTRTRCMKEERHLAIDLKEGVDYSQVTTLPDQDLFDIYRAV